MSFDIYAKTWDTEERIERARIIADEIRKTVELDNNSCAMEFGCGTGLISFNLYDRFKEITLVDSSKGMIDILNSKIEKYKTTNMTACMTDLTNGGELKSKYDAIYNSMVLHHIYDVDTMLSKFHELLNYKGVLCIVDLDEEDGSFHKNYSDYDGHNGFDQKELSKSLIKAGFSNIESKTFYHGIKVLDGEEIKYSLFIMTAKK